MHPQAFDFVRRMLGGIKTRGARVLEIGSFNVNGSVRPLFAEAESYTGIDLREGPGVDVKADGATWKGDGEPFDIVVSTEALEHYADPAAVVANAANLLKSGGWLLITAAAPERAPHSNDGEPELGRGEHYGNIAPDALAGWLVGWEPLHVEHHSTIGDVYLAARKPTESQLARRLKVAEVAEAKAAGDEPAEEAAAQLDEAADKPARARKG